jgi:predicted nucleotidyltransferase
MDRRQVGDIALLVMEEHACHTVILYGSYARGDATPHSDIDLLAVREGGATVRDARVVQGAYLDAFVYPEAKLESLDASFLRLLGGVVMAERNGFGRALLERVQALEAQGPPPMPEDERRALVVWSQKMLDRFRGRDDIEANYRRMLLLPTALEDYFLLRGLWFRGSKEGFAWLREHDPRAYAAFERAARPGAPDEAFCELVDCVFRFDAASGR